MLTGIRKQFPGRKPAARPNHSHVLKRAACAILAAVLTLQPAAPAAHLLQPLPAHAAADDEGSLSFPTIPYGDDLSDYDPEEDGYYAYLHIAYKSGLPVKSMAGSAVRTAAETRIAETDFVRGYLPVIVFEGNIFARADQIPRISGLVMTQDGSRICYKYFERTVYLAVQDSRAYFTAGKDPVPLIATTHKLRGIPFFDADTNIWVPLADIFNIMGVQCSVPEDEDKDQDKDQDQKPYYRIVPPERESFDVMAKAWNPQNRAIYKFKYGEDQLSKILAGATSKSITVFNNTVRMDLDYLYYDALKDMENKVPFASLFNLSEDQWDRICAEEYSKKLLFCDAVTADQFYVTASQNAANASAILMGDYAQAALPDAASAMAKLGDRLKSVKPPASLSPVKVQKQQLLGTAWSNRLNALGQKAPAVMQKADFLLGVGAAAIQAAGSVIQYCELFEHRSELVEDSLTELLKEEKYSHISKSGAKKLKSELETLQKSESDYAFRHTMWDVFGSFDVGLVVGAISSPAVLFSAGYQLAADLIPGFSRQLDNMKAYQVSLFGLQYQDEAEGFAQLAFAEAFLNGSPALVKSSFYRDEMQAVHLFLQGCLVTRQLAEQAAGEEPASSTSLDQELAADMSILSAEYIPESETESATQLNPVRAAFEELKNAQSGAVIQSAEALYMTLSGEVRKEEDKTAVDDAFCHAAFAGEECGTFSGTPGGEYKKISFPLLEPDEIVTDRSAYAGQTLNLGFTSPTVEGSDTVIEPFQAAVEKDARTAYLGEFNWYRYIRDQLAPVMGYAETDPRMRDVTSRNAWDSAGWSRRQGIFGADVTDMDGDEVDDLLLYYFGPMTNNNRGYRLMADLYTRDGSVVQKIAEIPLCGINAINFESCRVGITEIDGRKILMEESIGDAYFADGFGMNTNFYGWDGQEFRCFWMNGKSAGGSDEIAYSLRTYKDSEHYDDYELYTDQSYLMYNKGAHVGAFQTYNQAMAEGYRMLGFPNAPEQNITSTVNTEIEGPYPTIWDSGAVKQSVTCLTIGSGNYSARHMTDECADLTELMKHIEELGQ